MEVFGVKKSGGAWLGAWLCRVHVWLDGAKSGTAGLYRAGPWRDCGMGGGV
jgi:hypothetical protein